MIGHLDMDAFFARCEILRNPGLEGKPVVICVYTRGGSSGAVSTCSYEARENGIGSGMALSAAKEKAPPGTVFLPVDHVYYRKKSREVFSVLRSFSKQVEEAGIDEAYFRVESEPRETAKKIAARVETLGLSASIGVAPNKHLAKMASEERKPAGITVVKNDEVRGFLEGRDVCELRGVGGVTCQKLSELGVESCEGLREIDVNLLIEEFGLKKAVMLKSRARGEGSTELGREERKQRSRIRTLPEDSSDYFTIKRELGLAARELWERLSGTAVVFSSVTVIGVDTGLNTHTRSRKVRPSGSGEKMFRQADNLLQRLLNDLDAPLRRVGVRVSGFESGRQSSLSSFA